MTFSGQKVKIKCKDCKQSRKAIKQWNYKFKEFIYKLEYCWGCYDKANPENKRKLI